MEYITRTYRFEVLASNSLFYNPKANRKVAEMTSVEEEVFEIELMQELYEEFDGDINIAINMKDRTIRMLKFRPSALHDSWETFAFRNKGIAITSKYHIRLVETM
jgi:hypothetical protein